MRGRDLFGLAVMITAVLLVVGVAGRVALLPVEAEPSVPPTAMATPTAVPSVEAAYTTWRQQRQMVEGLRAELDSFSEYGDHTTWSADVNTRFEQTLQTLLREQDELNRLCDKYNTAYLAHYPADGSGAPGWLPVKCLYVRQVAP